MTFSTHFHSQLERTGDRPVTFLPEHGEPQTITYAGLHEQASAIGAGLAAGGFTDQPVILLYPSGPEFLAAFLGCLYARVPAVAAPLPQTGPQHQTRLQSLIADAGANLVLTTGEHVGPLQAMLPDTPVQTAGSRDHDPMWTPPRIEPSTIAYLQYTSGSTSQPRGVQIPHSALTHNIASMQSLAADPPRVMAGWLPHYHDMGLVGLLLHALYAGTPLVFMAPATFVARPVRWLRMLTDYQADWTIAPDFGYERCTRRITDEQLAGLDLSRLVAAHTGAEPVKAATINDFSRRFAPVGFRHDAWAPAYGMAEATLMITGTRQGTGPVIGTFDQAKLEQHHAEPRPRGVPLVASGRSAGLDVRITDPVTADPLPDGDIGEILVAGPSVAAGYRHHPDATRHTFHAGDGSHLRTGDLGFILDEHLYVTGRLNDIIIVNGRNLYPQDIEETARLAHPATGAAGAAFTTTNPDGSTRITLVQEVRPLHPAPNDIAAAITAAITAAIGAEFGIAITIVFVAAGTIPRTTSGKIRRRHTRDLLLGGQLAEPGTAPAAT